MISFTIIQHVPRFTFSYVHVRSSLITTEKISFFVSLSTSSIFVYLIFDLLTNSYIVWFTAFWPHFSVSVFTDFCIYYYFVTKLFNFLKIRFCCICFRNRTINNGFFPCLGCSAIWIFLKLFKALHSIKCRFSYLRHLFCFRFISFHNYAALLDLLSKFKFC